MTMQEVLQAAHLRFEKNTTYPDPSSEDFLVRLAYGNDGIKMWAKEVKEGVLWKPLKKDASFVASGNGTDSLTTNVPDFYTFLRAEEQPAIIISGKTEWQEVTPQDGSKAIQDGVTNGYVFWVEAGNLRTLPSIAGTVQFPYIKKPTKYVTGLESTPIEIEDEEFLIEYILGMLYLDDNNMSQYQAHMENAKDYLFSMKISTINEIPSDNGFGMGM